MSNKPSFYKQMAEAPEGALGGLTFYSKRTFELISFSIYKKMHNGSLKLMVHWPIPGKDIKEVNLSLKEIFS